MKKQPFPVRRPEARRGKGMICGGNSRMFRIAICDDSRLWLQKIQDLTQAYFQKIHAACHLDLYTSGEDFLAGASASYDIALLDVNLKSMNGINVAMQLKTICPQTVLIFVSEYVEYAPMGYETDAIRYLLKDHLDRAFDRVMEAAVKKVQEKHIRYAIATDAGNLMVRLEDILYVESQKRKVIYHLQNNARSLYVCSEQLSKVEERLGTQGFLRPHRTLLVNMRHIRCISRLNLVLTDGTELPVSKQNSREVIQAYNLWVGAL